jgi:hypothetical protein
MQSECVGRAVLLPTAHYGRSPRKFVKDKEIMLIHGLQLLHLLRDHGHRVRVDPRREGLLREVSALDCVGHRQEPLAAGDH